MKSLAIQTHCSVVKALSSESGYLGSILAGHWNSLQPLGHFVWHWAGLSPSVHWHMHFYIAALSIFFHLLNFVSGNLALTKFVLPSVPCAFQFPAFTLLSYLQSLTGGCQSLTESCKSLTGGFLNWTWRLPQLTLNRSSMPNTNVPRYYNGLWSCNPTEPMQWSSFLQLQRHKHTYCTKAVLPSTTAQRGYSGLLSCNSASLRMTCG